MPLCEGMLVQSNTASYRLDSPLGTGGEATVWRGKNQKTEELVAIKFYPVTPFPIPEARREAAAMRKIHPKLVSLLDAGQTEEGQHFLVLEYVPGKDARTLLEEGQVPLELALKIGAEVFLALDALHQVGLVHADIKPENIRLMEGSHAVRVVDFGRARLNHLLGACGIFPGTRPYMLPSLHRSGSAPGIRSDCFATWVTIFELATGLRPYTRQMLASAQDDALPPPATEPPEVLKELLWAGLSGRLQSARQSYVAIQRFLLGDSRLPIAGLARPLVSVPLVNSLAEQLQNGDSVALLGQPESCRVVLEAVDRLWRSKDATVLWARGAWLPPKTPMAAALSLALQIGDILCPEDQERLAATLGPLGSVIADRVPATRAWLSSGHRSSRPEAEQLQLALRRLLGALPKPVLVLAEAMDKADGASRRFLSALAAEKELVVLASARPGMPHGMPLEQAVPPSPLPRSAPATELSPEALVLHEQARVLSLPFNTILAQATQRSEQEVETLGLECEAAGFARWNGSEVVVLETGESHESDQARVWLKAAAQNLDLRLHPLLIAEYARASNHTTRLAEVLDIAVEEAQKTDPALALEFLQSDPRPITVQHQLKAAQMALLARQPQLAWKILDQLKSLPETPADQLADLEADLHFLEGSLKQAMPAARNSLVLCGENPGTSLFNDLLALARVRLNRPIPEKPDPLMARRYERLHDLHFLSDNRGMLHLHGRWLCHAPYSWRARAMKVIWYSALGMTKAAEDLEKTLLAEGDEEQDPIGGATVVLHRGIARLWRGDVPAAFADGLDASERLLAAGDPYLASLATTIVTVGGLHLGKSDVIRRLARELDALGRLTHDARARSWVSGQSAVAAWMEGDLQSAIALCQKWVAEAAARGENTETVARRFLGELYLDCSRLSEALTEFQTTQALIARYHLSLDFTDAVVIGLRIVSIRSKQGDPWKERMSCYFLTWRSPRWKPRVLAASAWAARGEARQRLFEEAEALALSRHQEQDAVWIRHQRALAG
jgi:serine/threonine protein kinase